jgi:hypothetical protein
MRLLFGAWAGNLGPQPTVFIGSERGAFKNLPFGR